MGSSAHTSSTHGDTISKDPSTKEIIGLSLRWLWHVLGNWKQPLYEELNFYNLLGERGRKLEVERGGA